MASAAELIGYLFLAYAFGWSWGAGELAFKRLSEAST